MTRNEKTLLALVAVLGVMVIGSSLVTAGGLLALNQGWLSMGAGSEGATAQVSEVVQAQLPAATLAPAPTAAPAQRAPILERLRSSAGEARDALPLPEPRVDIGADLSSLYDQVNPGVVSVIVETGGTATFQGQPFRQRGSGSGFVYDDRHIVTNNHVAGDANEIEIVFFDGSRRPGTLVGADVYSDLAVVRVEDMPASARVLPLTTDLGGLKVGQPVVAIGNPFEKANSMTFGIVSALGRTIPDGQTSFSIPEAIQTDAAINPGNSGGPLLDLRGQVVGVNAQINTNNIQGNIPGSSGVGFAIPASVVSVVVPDLINDGRHAWSYLGVSGNTMSADQAAATGLDDQRGAYIQCVPGDGPSAGRLQGSSNVNCDTGALTSGDVPVGGDLVVAIDGVPVTSFDDLLSYIGLQTQPGQEVRLTVLRDGRQQDVTVVLAARPDR